MKSIFSKTAHLSSLALVALSMTSSANAFVQPSNARAVLSTYTLDVGHWYAGANIGVSHLHDDPNPGSGNSVDENGPGASVVGGYQFNSMFGAELGYTYYKNSRETVGGFVIAKTDHYSVDLAATGRYPLVNQISGLGKLGVAYSYAQKIASGFGAAASASAGSLYWGLGVDYSITPRADFIIQFAEAVGNHLTGSADLWSVGFNFAIV